MWRVVTLEVSRSVSRTPLRQIRLRLIQMEEAKCFVCNSFGIILTFFVLFLQKFKKSVKAVLKHLHFLQAAEGQSPEDAWAVADAVALP